MQSWAVSFPPHCREALWCWNYQTCISVLYTQMIECAMHDRYQAIIFSNEIIDKYYDAKMWKVKYSPGDTHYDWFIIWHFFSRHCPASVRINKFRCENEKSSFIIAYIWRFSQASIAPRADLISAITSHFIFICGKVVGKQPRINKCHRLDIDWA